MMLSEENESPTPPTPPTPPLPPTPEAPAVLRGASAPLLEGRLHPATLFFVLLGVIRGAIFPLIAAFLTRGKAGTFLYVVLGFVCLSFVWALIRFFTFSYRIEDNELVTREGLIGKKERHIPLSRVQDVRLEQSILQRVLGVVRVDVETGGGGGAEASLSVLSQAEAERLRQAIFSQYAPRSVPAEGIASPMGDPEAAIAGPAVYRPAQSTGETVRAVSLSELALHGLTANHTGTALAFLFGWINFADDLLPKDADERFYRWAAGVARHGVEQAGGVSPVAVIILTVSGVLILLAVMAALSVVGSIMTYYGFRLGRNGEDLHRSYGLLTHRASRLPRRRIQVLKIEQEFLRRLLGLATLRADTAGSPMTGQQNGGGDAATSQAGRDMLLPVVPAQVVPDLLPEILPGIENEPPADWRRVSPKAVSREARPGIIFSLIAALAVSGLLWFLPQMLPARLGRPSLPLGLGGLPLLLAPLFYVRSLLHYRHLGYAPGKRYFRLRSGSMTRSEWIVPVRNIQSITLRQTPFDRKHGLGSIRIDTAGQTYTGGGPHIEHLPYGAALALARSLAQKAERSRYHWEK